MIGYSEKEILDYLFGKSEALIEGVPVKDEKQNSLCQIEMLAFLFMKLDNRLWHFNKKGDYRQKCQKLFVDKFNDVLKCNGIQLQNPRSFFMKRVSIYVKLMKRAEDFLDYMDKLIAHIIEHSELSEYNPFASPIEMVQTSMDILLLHTINSVISSNLTELLPKINREIDYFSNGGPDVGIEKKKDFDDFHEDSIDEVYYDSEPWKSFLNGKSGKRLNQAKTIVDVLASIKAQCGGTKAATNACNQFLDVISLNENTFFGNLESSVLNTDLWTCSRFIRSLSNMMEKTEFASELFGLMEVYDSAIKVMQRITSKEYAKN